MNPGFIAILEETLRRGFETLTLTNALKPMDHRKPDIARLAKRYGQRMRVRVSLDDCRAEVHDRERGEGAFAHALDGLIWLWRAGVALEVAAQFLSGDTEADLRQGFAALFAECGVGIDCEDEKSLLFLPEMRPGATPPEITEACWGILKKSPGDVMCSSARMVVKRKGAALARRGGLHASSLRQALRAWRDVGRGEPGRSAFPSLLRQLLRSRRRFMRIGAACVMTFWRWS